MQGGVVSPEDIYKLRFEELLGSKSTSYFEELEPEEEVVETNTTEEIVPVDTTVESKRKV
jgi:hypothetical protein